MGLLRQGKIEKAALEANVSLTAGRLVFVSPACQGTFLLRPVARPQLEGLMLRGRLR